MSYEIYDGDLFDFEGGVIAHQCNLTSKGVSGLASAVFAKHPQANHSHMNPNHNLFGKISVTQIENFPYKYVANLYSQLYPGVAGFDDNDSYQMRLTKFEECLIHLANFTSALPSKDRSIAMPYLIGCNLAGGNWKDYSKAIDKIAKRYYNIDFHIIEKK